MAVAKMSAANRMRMELREIRAKYVAQGKPDAKALKNFDKQLRWFDGNARVHSVK